MFATTFTFNNSYNQYELKVDGSKFDVTVEWLHKFKVKFNATAFSKYVLFELINPSQSVVDKLDAKFNPMTTEEFISLFNLNPLFTYFDQCNTIAEVKAEYRRLAKSMHPDCGGNTDEFVKLNQQYQEALQFVAA